MKLNSIVRMYVWEQQIGYSESQTFVVSFLEITHNGELRYGPKASEFVKKEDAIEWVRSQNARP